MTVKNIKLLLCFKHFGTEGVLIIVRCFDYICLIRSLKGFYTVYIGIKLQGAYMIDCPP
ncbi:hypothetical protein Cst_c17690 [Thermoclostridium stercorarium subsp. stercorarium DSM 8532]|uniref:Uncharacterized protein n=1 Tax=Thermoclostridium stercorarium (strain ATCC 35414 / DSM 8532 / NCIMB 11754) TaxID=1121335 RepID=L7VPY5_THES1|nr:hypothetical protein Cst_c17690 [Thermoclostridium stercorarium subsp. stercorarium DSM 8532]